MTFVEWECGCIGLKSDNLDDTSIVLKACDDDNREYCFVLRNHMDKKKSKILPTKFVEEIIRDINWQIAKGYRLDEIKVCLNY